MKFSFFVHGKPKPGGSKKGFLIRRRNGSIGISMSDANPNVHEWRRVVADKAKETYHGDLIDQALRIRVDFIMVRPKGHFRKNGSVKPDAPRFPTVRPDTTKLLRALEDALTGVIWRDDSLIVSQEAGKFYGTSYGAFVVIETL